MERMPAESFRMESALIRLIRGICGLLPASHLSSNETP
jgi:hypothetical protein